MGIAQVDGGECDVIVIWLKVLPYIDPTPISQVLGCQDIRSLTHAYIRQGTEPLGNLCLSMDMAL